MAEDQEIGKIVREPVPLGTDWQRRARTAEKRGLSMDWDSNIISRAPKSFAPPAEGGADAHEGAHTGETDRLKTLKLLRDTLAQLKADGKAKRTLVTLNEANEVARRLAAMKVGSAPASGEEQKGEEDEEDEDEKEETQVKDEVQLWL